jgi:hypothetical protein
MSRALIAKRVARERFAAGARNNDGVCLAPFAEGAPSESAREALTG